MHCKCSCEGRPEVHSCVAAGMQAVNAPRPAVQAGGLHPGAGAAGRQRHELFVDPLFQVG